MHNIGFADVENGKTEAIRWSAANEIVTGYGSGKFGHEAVLTHEQLTTILYRYTRMKSQGFTGLLNDLRRCF